MAANFFYNSVEKLVLKKALYQTENEKNSMVLAAKMGQWDKVWEILDKNPHYVNCIPEKRKWGILHQACHWENEEAIKKILSVPGCDPNLETKDGKRAKEILKTEHLKEVVEHTLLRVTEIENLRFALERGDMEHIIKIIDYQNQLVNVTSPVTGLAPIHQAALLGNVETVTKILDYPASNPDVKTIKAPLNTHGPGCTADQLTKSEDVKTVISWKKRQLRQEYHECPTFVNISDSNLLLMGHVCRGAIEEYTGLLCSDNFISGEFEDFPKILENIFLYIHYSFEWQVTKNIVCKNIRKYSQDLAEECYAINSQESFYRFFISIYTNYNTGIFKKINSEIFNQYLDYKDDSAFCLFSTMLNAILFFWADLPSYNGVTYRAMRVSPGLIHEYSVGNEFAWPCFISCSGTISKDLSDAHLNLNCIFVFDNILECEWSPKCIAQVIECKDEAEYLYPCGAQFRITKVGKFDLKTHIYCNLIRRADTDSGEIEQLYFAIEKGDMKNITNIPQLIGESHKINLKIMTEIDNIPGIIKTPDLLNNFKQIFQMQRLESLRTLYKEPRITSDYCYRNHMGTMFLAGLMGHWDIAREILNASNFLVNCISDEFSCGILHLACFWENEEAVKHILSIPRCNPNIKTKYWVCALDITMSPSIKELITKAAEKIQKIDQLDFAVERGDMIALIDIVNENNNLVNEASYSIGLAPLHQAAVQEDVFHVIKLLDYPASNPDVVTIEAPLNTHGVDKTADQLTDNEDVKVVISWKRQQLKLEYYGCPTFVDINDSNLLLMRYVCPTIETHRNLLCSKKFATKQFDLFLHMTEIFYLYIHYVQNWKVAKKLICKELFQHSRRFALECGKTECEISFFKHLIKIYTNDTTQIYKKVNTELSNLAVEENIEFSLYTTLLNAILFFWDKLYSYRDVTYRGARIPLDQIDQYSVGVEFAWLKFVSSSNDKNVAESFIQESFFKFNKIKSLFNKYLNVDWFKNTENSGNYVRCIFIIDNSLKCKWSPKSIAEFSQIKNESEYLYPCGAQFRVTNVDRSGQLMHIYLELICPVDDTPLRSFFDEIRARAEYSILQAESKLDQLKIDLNELEHTLDEARSYTLMLNLLRNDVMCDLHCNREGSEFEPGPPVSKMKYYCTKCHDPCCGNNDVNFNNSLIGSEEFYRNREDIPLRIYPRNSVTLQDKYRNTDSEFRQIIRSKTILIAKLFCFKPEIDASIFEMGSKLKELNYMVSYEMSDQDRFLSIWDHTSFYFCTIYCLIDLFENNSQFRYYMYPEEKRIEMRENIIKLALKMQKNGEISHTLDMNILKEEIAGENLIHQQKLLYILQIMSRVISRKIDASFTALSET